MTDYLELRCLWPAHQEEALAQVLDAVPILGAETGPVDGDRVELAVFMPGDRTAEAARLGQLLSAAGARGLEITGFEGRDWLSEYRASTRPFAVGDRWWIDPFPGSPTPAPEGRLRLAVEPRTAFGSGTHESTRLVLAFLEEVPLRGLRVLDVGTGSGILAMAAAALSAARVVGLDIDPMAAIVARQTLRQQEVVPDVAVFAGGIEAVARGTFDLALCNMISSRFLPLLDDIRSVIVPRGALLLSGFLGSEEPVIREAVDKVGFKVADLKTLGEWSGMKVVDRGR